MNYQASFFPDHLSQEKQRLSGSQKTYTHYLDKNEQPEDVPDWLKMQVLQNAMNMDWNRYPAISNADIEQEIATTFNLQGSQVLLGSGSATFITALLNFFGMQRQQIVIAQPSYSLFDYHCKTYGIDYAPWMLNASLEYDETLLPAMQEGSVLFIVSPNNPVGNSIPKPMLKNILRTHPGTLVILDAVYAAFEDEDLSGLLQQFDNLIMMRSFSKELPVAGLRLGYLCGSETVIGTVRKLVLPFTINPLSLAFARHLLFDPEFQDWAAVSRDQIKAERERMYAFIQQNIAPGMVTVFPSSGNFLLFRIHEDEAFTSVLSAFDQAAIKVLDTSPMPLLKNTFRVSIGCYEANDTVIACMMEVLKPVMASVPCHPSRLHR